ncbi:hypothetical protein ACOMHN_027623 [Nucella lapillus]
MPLMEGVGDEVLVVVGVFVVLCVGLLAWLSTHTRDIPFVSVIVVELSQRRQRATNAGGDTTTTATTTAGEERGAGDQAETAPGESAGGPDREEETFNNNADTANDGVEDSASAAASRNSVLEYVMSQCVADGSAKLSDSPVPPSSVSEPNQCDATEQAAEGPCLGEESEEVVETIPPFVPSECESGEEVRRRRVAYFSGGLKPESSEAMKKDALSDADTAATMEEDRVGRVSGEVEASTASRQESAHSGQPVASSELLVSVSESRIISESRVVSSSPAGASSPSTQSLELPSFSAESLESEASPSPQKTPSAPSAEGMPRAMASIQESASAGKTVSGESLPGSPEARPAGEGTSASAGERETVRSDSAERSDTAGQQIRVRLKYLNDSQRLVYTHPHETIGNFRRLHFSSELEDDKTVRFIFKGQDLRNDLSTLQAYSVADNSVVHCLVTQTPRIQPTPGPSGGVGGPAGGQEEDGTMGALLFPVFGVILGLVWYLRFVYKQYFNAMSTVSLAGISFIYLLAVFSSLRNRRQPHQHLE